MNEVLPLAFTMMIGPQIITSIILVTSKNAIRASLAFVGGVLTASLVGASTFYLISLLLGFGDIKSAGQPSKAALFIQTGLIFVLVIMALKTYINRENVKLPSWMSSLQNASPKSAFRTALMLIFFMPTDLIVMSTVGINLASRGSNSYVHLAPFIFLTTLIAAAPLLAYLLFRKKAVTAMPKIRLWMETNSWVVTVIAYGFFLYLLWP